MSGYDEDGFDEQADEFEDAFYDDPVGTIGAVVNQAASEVAQQVAQQVEQELTIQRGQMAAGNAREADAAMVARYGSSWEELRPMVAEHLKVDYASGRLPVHDGQALAESFETHYLAARERARPSKAEEDAAYWARVRSAEHREYGY